VKALVARSPRWVWALLALWVAYAITGLRAPWSPILVSDGDAGGALRKVLFGLTGLVAALALVEARCLDAVAGRQRRLLGLAACVLATALYSQDPALSAKRGVLLLLAVLAVCTAVHAARDPVRRMQAVLVGGAALAAWVSLAAWAVLPAECSSIAERRGLAGVTSHPNTLGAICAVGLTLSLGVDARSLSQHATLWGARAGLALALVLTGSLTSLVFVSVACGVTWFLSVPTSTRCVALLLLALGALALLGAWLILGAGGLLEAAGRDSSLSGRDQLWGAVWQAGCERPVFGSGYGAFWYEGRGREIVGTWNPRQAHNAFLDLFVDLGVIGATIVLGSILAILGQGWGRWRSAPLSPERWATASAIGVSLGLLCVYGCGESYLLKPDKFVFFSLLWVLALLDRARPIGVRS
jgi:exopolysaccharide production protein ExoQ